MNYKLEELIDIPLFQNLQDKLNVIYSFPSAIIDNEGKILTAVAWQDICTKFHRNNPECEKECIKSDRYILDHLHEANPAVSYQCPHGLTDNATPIFIEGKHLGNFFTGQFFLEPPDLEFFRKQAKKYGFDEEAYLEAVKKTPVWTKEKLKQYLDFIKGFIEIIAGIGLKNLIEIEANKTINETKELNATILLTAMDGFWITDMSGHLLVVNDSYCRMSGFSQQELLGMKITDLEVIETEEINIAHIKAVMERGDDRFISRHFRKDRTIFDVEVSVQFQPVSGGRLVVFLRDITELKKTDAAIIEREKHYRTLFENATDGIMYISFTGEIVRVNSSFAKMHGYTVDEMKTMKVQDLDVEDQAEVMQSRIQRITNGESFRFEVMHRHKDGHLFSLEVSACMVSLGDTNYVIAFHRDITERKQADLALTQSRNLLFNLANLVPGVIYQYRLYPDGSSAFPYSSPGMNDIYEVTPEEVREDATPVFGRLHPEDAERVGAEIFESARTLQTFYCEFRVVLPRQGLRWRWSQAQPERTPDGGTLWHGIISDITDRKLVELELIKAKEHAEESDRLKSAFLANMSHEIRTPMNGILGFADLLKEPGLTGEEQQKYIRIIEKSGARMLNIINDIVEISKIESGQMDVVIKESDINEQIEFLNTFFKPEVEAKGMTISFKTPLPANVATILTDREKLYAILTNLVKNAIKYTNNGSIEFGYDIVEAKHASSLPPVTPTLQFYVKDTGIGIPKDRQEAIFERFIQADIADTRAFQGAGLGLSISKAYVEMLGGKMWVESEEEKGSVFYFTIPYNTEIQHKIPFENINQQERTDNGTMNLKVLIAEDDETSEMLLSLKLDKFSREILKTKNGIETVEMCRNNPDIDLILMDIQMSGMDGYEATREIRKFNRKVIIIAQTAYGLSGDREKALEAGCNDYVAKPIDGVLFLRMISKYFT